MAKKGLGKFIAGAALGGALGVLFAPKKGSESRKDLTKKAKDTIDSIKTIDYEEVKKNVEDKIQALTKEVKDLDKEKVLKIAKEKATKLKQQANDLVDYAIEKGSPVIQKTAEDAKNKTIDLLNTTIKKLEGTKQSTNSKTTKKTATKK